MPQNHLRWRVVILVLVLVLILVSIDFAKSKVNPNPNPNTKPNINIATRYHRPNGRSCNVFGEGGVTMVSPLL